MRARIRGRMGREDRVVGRNGKGVGCAFMRTGVRRLTGAVRNECAPYGMHEAPHHARARPAPTGRARSAPTHRVGRWVSELSQSVVFEALRLVSKSRWHRSMILGSRSALEL